MYSLWMFCLLSMVSCGLTDVSECVDIRASSDVAKQTFTGNVISKPGLDYDIRTNPVSVMHTFTSKMNQNYDKCDNLVTWLNIV